MRVSAEVGPKPGFPFSLDAPRGAKSDARKSRLGASMRLADLARLKPKLRELECLSLCVPSASRARRFGAFEIFGN